MSLTNSRIPLPFRKRSSDISTSLQVSTARLEPPSRGLGGVSIQMGSCSSINY